jgi:hypothetical protein
LAEGCVLLFRFSVNIVLFLNRCYAKVHFDHATIFVQAATADIRMAVATATVAPEVALAADTGSLLQWPQQPSQPPLFTPTNRTNTKSMFRISQPLLSVSHRCIERAREIAGHRNQSPDICVFQKARWPRKYFFLSQKLPAPGGGGGII